MSTSSEPASTSPAPSASPAPQKAQSASPFGGLILNILLPVLVLNKLDRLFPSVGPWWTLVIALCFPLAGAAQEFWSKRRVGALPSLGLLNVLGTGGLAALGLGGIWFAIKEALFPFLIGLVVLYSAFGRKPLAEAIFLNDAVVKTETIYAKLDADGSRETFIRHLKTATLILAGSFFLSAILNFGLAIHVFEPLPDSLSPEARAQALNQQVARMTWLGFVVIAVPSVACTAAAFFGLLRDIKKLTGLKDTDIFRS